MSAQFFAQRDSKYELWRPTTIIVMTEYKCNVLAGTVLCAYNTCYIIPGTRDLWGIRSRGGAAAGATSVLVVTQSSPPPPPRFLRIRFPRNVFLRRDGMPRDDGPFVGRNRLAPAAAAAAETATATAGGGPFIRSYSPAPDVLQQ